MWNYCKWNRILIIIKIFGRHKLVPTLRSGKVWQIWCFSMFLSILLTAISKFDTFSSYHIVRTRIAKVTNFLPFCTIGISMYQKRILPYFIIPSTFSPQASSPLERYGQRNFFTPRYLSSFFFPLSARGPTRRRNSTGLAELWGGWPIELGNTILVKIKLWELDSI